MWFLNFEKIIFTHLTIVSNNNKCKNINTFLYDKNNCVQLITLKIVPKQLLIFQSNHNFNCYLSHFHHHVLSNFVSCACSW